jgi:hypothetical protein
MVRILLTFLSFGGGFELLSTDDKEDILESMDSAIL